MSLLKKLAGETALYGLSSIVGRTLNYLLVPLHTSVYYGFAAYDFGILSELYVYMAFLNIIFLYGMETAFFRYASKGDMQQSYNLTLSSILVSTFVFSGILIAFSAQFALLLGYPDKANFLIWLILILSIDTILAIPFARLRQEKKAKQFATAKIINVLLTIFFNLFFLVFCKAVYAGHWLPFLKPLINLFYSPQLGIGYVFLSNLLANAFLFLLLYQSFLSFRFQFDWQKLKPMLIYAYPLLFMGLAGTINGMIDRIMLKYYLPDNFYPDKNSIAAMGVYAACYKLSIFMSLAIQSFKYAAEPFFFSQAQDKNAPELFAKVMKYFIIACTVIWILVSLNLDILQYFLQRAEYREGIAVVPILLLANLFLGVYYNLSVWFKLSDQTYYGTWISGGGAIITLTLNFIFIPYFGYMACAWVTLITYFSMAVTCYFLGQKHYPIPYKISSAFSHIFGGVLLIVIAFWFKIENVWLAIAFHALLFGFYLLFIFLTEKNRILVKN